MTIAFSAKETVSCAACSDSALASCGEAFATPAAAAAKIWVCYKTKPEWRHYESTLKCQQ